MSANVVDNIIGRIKPAIKPEEVISILSSYTDGVEKVSREVTQHVAGQVHRNSEMMMTWMQFADPIKRIEVAQTWMLNSGKGYHSMLHRITTIGHETVGQIAKKY